MPTPSSDNVTLLSANMMRLPGASITASASLSGYFPELAIDGNRSTIWYSSSTSSSDYLTIDCGGTLPAVPDRFFLHGNCSDYTLYGSADGTTWGTALLDLTGKPAAAMTNFTGSTAYRYFKVVLSGTITASQYRQVQQMGVYKQEYVFSDLYNPLFDLVMSEAGQERLMWDGGTYRPTVRELHTFNLPIERIPTADYVAVRDWWRSWRNQCAVLPEKTTRPQELYDLVCGPLALRYFQKYKALGYTGGLTFKEY